MSIQDIKNNVKVIQHSLIIPNIRKHTLLLNQLHTLDVLMSDNSKVMLLEEKKEVYKLVDDVQSYLLVNSLKSY